MSMREYSLNFTKLSMYAPCMVVDPSARMSKFISGVSNFVSKECKTSLLMKEMDISRLMTYAELIEEEKLRSKLECLRGFGCVVVYILTKREVATKNFKVAKSKEAKGLPTFLLLDSARTRGETQSHKLLIALNVEGPTKWSV